MDMMTKIKHRTTGRVIAEGDCSIRELAEVNKYHLAGANLAGADLSGADIQDANLSGANLSGADLADTNLSGADLRYASGLPLAPAIPSIDAAILAAIATPGCALDMSDWHRCETTHCWGGWTIHLAGEAGKKLEIALGTNAAAALIYAASGSHPVPDWAASEEDAMADLRRRAGVEVKA